MTMSTVARVSFTIVISDSDLVIIGSIAVIARTITIAFVTTVGVGVAIVALFSLSFPCIMCMDAVTGRSKEI